MPKKPDWRTALEKKGGAISENDRYKIKDSHAVTSCSGGMQIASYEAHVLVPMRASTPNNPRVDENNDVLATLRVEAYFQLNSAKTQIKITKVHATVKQRASYAIIQSRTAGACQGPQFAQIKTQNFNTNETTITTGWGYIPFMSYSESNGLVCNGGMVESGVTSVGMGDTVLRAEAYV